MRRVVGMLAGVTLCLAGIAAPCARADLFGAIELASASAVPGGLHEQAEEARFPVISGNGRYVAFVGRFGGESGIWRRDLASGAVEQVAPGAATMPSISANGRYVSFTTNEQLLPADTNKGPDVYRRDMEPGPGEPAYMLVSAVNGSEEGATYTYTGEEQYSQEQQESDFGALAAPRSAMSANGEYVVFVTTAQSDILGTGEPTPTDEVLVRDVATEETRLVSAEYEPGAGWAGDRPVQPATNEEGRTSYGAVFPGSGETPRFGNYRGETDGLGTWWGASISADGSTVAWMGQDLARQAELLPGEQAEESPQTAEPLWRRIDEGPGAPIRRVSGGSDPEDPLCAASGEQKIAEHPASSLDPCTGPFEHYSEHDEGLWGNRGAPADFVPQLSADGETVAFITGARELSIGEQFESAEVTDDLYVVDMANGLTRVQALRRLTEIGGGGSTQEKIERSAKIVDYSVSADGSQVAFTTQRTQFPLGSPTFVSPLAAAPGMIELFDVDLSNETITRVTHGFEGEDERSEELPKVEVPGTDPYQLQQGSYSPSFSEDGSTLCFASTANNLVYGDGNDAPDAFIVHRLSPAAGAVQQFVSPAPASPALVPPWKLGVSAVSLPDGGVRVYVEVPAAGELSASASGGVLVHTSAKGSRSAHGSSRRHVQTLTLATRRLAAAKAAVTASSDGLVALTLTLAPAYRGLASAKAGLPARVSLAFTSPGRPILRASLRVSFRRTLEKKKKAKAKSSRARRTSARRPAGGGGLR